MSQSLIRSINLLEHFDEQPELSLLELVEMANMPKTTVHRMVNSLVESGLLVKVKYSAHDVKYKLGLRLLELGMKVVDQLEYRKIALPYMRRVNSNLNESVHLAVLEDYEAVYIDKLDSNKPIRLVIKIGARAPLYAGSAPKVLLAHMDKKEQEDYLERLELKKLSSNTITDIQQLVQELHTIRNNSYAFSKGEIYKDTIGYSCPIFDNAGNLVAALGVSIPVIEYSEEKGKTILKEIMTAARGISAELGYRS